MAEEFFRKRHHTPRLIITLLVCNIVWLLIGTIWLANLSKTYALGTAASDTFGIMLASYLYMWVVIPYLMLSKRVRRTFANGAPHVTGQVHFSRARAVVRALVLLVAVGLLIGGAIGVAITLEESNKPDKMYAAAKRDAAAQVLQQSQQEGAPTGFGDVLWLMSPAEVRVVRPNVAAGIQKDELVEFMSLYGRTGAICYVFDQNILTMIYITLPAPATNADFDAIQSQLVAQYGKMSVPVSSNTYELISERKWSRVRLAHVLARDADTGILTHQVLIHRTPNDE